GIYFPCRSFDRGFLRRDNSVGRHYAISRRDAGTGSCGVGEQEGHMADNITHGLAAALLAQAGLRQRYGALATVALVVGSELPDLDCLFDLGGPVSGFVNHRGITHSLFAGAGLALLGAALLWRVWRSYPYWRVTWLVYLGVLLHIGMDYLTSYGTQLFLPFDAGRYTADALFIVDFTYSALM